MVGFGNEFENKKQNSKSKINIDKIIHQGFLLHSQGNIKDALKNYKYCISAGVNDDRIYSNCGIILKILGNLNKQKITSQKIEINPNSHNAYTNLALY